MRLFIFIQVSLLLVIVTWASKNEKTELGNQYPRQEDEDEDEEEEYNEEEINITDNKTLAKVLAVAAAQDDKSFWQKLGFKKVNMTGAIKKAFAQSLKSPEPVQNFLIGWMVFLSSLEESINNRIDPPEVTLSPINQAIEDGSPLDESVHDRF